MTYYIEEMMDAAGIKPVKHEAHCVRIFMGVCVINEKKCPYKIKSRCKDFKGKKPFLLYPDFTPEKQIEIIKLIGLKHGFKILPNGMAKYPLSTALYSEPKLNMRSYPLKDFRSALAHLVTKLMETGELDKEKVKRILEND